jgi:hypothetical protein
MVLLRRNIRAAQPEKAGFVLQSDTLLSKQAWIAVKIRSEALFCGAQKKLGHCGLYHTLAGRAGVALPQAISGLQGPGKPCRVVV